MRRLLFSIPLAFLAACADDGAETPPPVRPVMSVVATAASPLDIGFAGTVQPQVSTPMGFRILGRLVSRPAEVGDLVARGQQLAAIDPTSLELAVRAAEADLAGARAQLADAESTAARTRVLRAGDAASQSVLEQADLGRASAQASVAKAEAALAKAREQLSYSTISADYDAVVTSVDAEVGQIVSAGETILTIARPDLRDAVVDVPLSAGTVAPGEAFSVALQVAPDVTVTGTAREVAPQADPLTRTFRVRIALADPPDNFRLGATITAYRRQAGPKTITLPLTALREEEGRSYVFVVDEAKGEVARREITVASRTGALFVPAGGVEEGERVVTAGVGALTDGQKVRLSAGENR
ncbi:efflux RND transporter periplasmic adaptor subunit [Rhizobiaceae bacterium BDR2-2]|uniref:Efflux RND transporter periplasmic adaptor subunit n=1 Tax=Ectorhizobium quercum TaxID=2965071 RepID=A0AAE3SX30_9HYPH|nr:efflux RND transporter periplasmic adaptor subunit [Ectorhizobium quercum]MCX9000040.1 efflux RND transporter periplasmic adaptor subunit [Ectorhizobium quercum]